MPSRPAAAALPVELARKLLRLVPGGGMRQDLARDEAPHGLAQRLVLRGERGMRLHDALELDQQLPGRHLSAGRDMHRLDAQRKKARSAMLHLHGFQHHERRARPPRCRRACVHGDHAAVHRREQPAFAAAAARWAGMDDVLEAVARAAAREMDRVALDRNATVSSRRRWRRGRAAGRSRGA